MAMSSDPRLLTEDEIHIFGVEIVAGQLRQDGFRIESLNTYRYSNPQIVCLKDGRLCFIAVRTSTYPNKGELESQDMLDRLVEHAEKHNAECYLARVGIANAHGKNDAEMSMAIRGGGYYIAYEGLEELRSGDRISLFRSSPLGAYNASGNIGLSVKRGEDGKFSLKAGPSDFNAGMMALALTWADDLKEDQKAAFSIWYGLPQGSWTSKHREVFGLAYIHYLHECKMGKWQPHKAVEASLKWINPQALPPLRNSITNEIAKLFENLFSESVHA